MSLLGIVKVVGRCCRRFAVQELDGRHKSVCFSLACIIQPGCILCAVLTSNHSTPVVAPPLSAQLHVARNDGYAFPALLGLMRGHGDPLSQAEQEHAISNAGTLEGVVFRLGAVDQRTPTEAMGTKGQDRLHHMSVWSPLNKD